MLINNLKSNDAMLQNGVAKKSAAVEEIIEEEKVPAVRQSVGVALWLNKFIVNTRNHR